MIHFLDNQVQHLIGNVLNLVRTLLFLDPLQDILLLHQVALVDRGNALLKVHQLGDLLDAVLLGLFRVVDLHEQDAQLIALVVNVLELGQDLLGLFVVVVV